MKDARVLRHGLLLGKQRKPGDIIEAAQLAKLAHPVLSALISQGVIEEIGSVALDERVAALEAEVTELKAQLAEMGAASTSNQGRGAQARRA